MTFYLLGTGAAVSDPHRTTTMLAVEEAGHFVLVDCGGDAFQCVLAAGLDPSKLEAVILTHEHPDHISGYPLLIEKLWLFGRREPIHVYGPAPTLEVARTLFGAFSTGTVIVKQWPQFGSLPGSSISAPSWEMCHRFRSCE